MGEFTARVPAGWSAQSGRPLAEFMLSANAYFELGRAADDDVRLVEYDPAWPAQFEAMASWIRRVAPPGIALRRRALRQHRYPEHARQAGYRYSPRGAVIRRRQAEPGPRLQPARVRILVVRGPHHVHRPQRADGRRGRTTSTRRPRGIVSGKGSHSGTTCGAHPDEAARYAALKRALAERNATDREEYTDSKADFVREVTAKALRSAG